MGIRRVDFRCSLQNSHGSKWVNTGWVNTGWVNTEPEQAPSRGSLMLYANLVGGYCWFKVTVCG